MRIRHLAALLLAMCVMGLFGAATAEGTGYRLGDKIEDFAITGCDDAEYTLYGLLEEKQMVLLNFWATWCGPCRSEFPAMEAAYQAYADKVAIVALSTEENDTNEVIANFAAENGMSFIMGRDETYLYYTGFCTGYVPTTVVIDRFGTVCYYEYSAMTDPSLFERLFDVFVGDDYTESVLLAEGIPAKTPDVAPVDPDELAAAIGSEGLTFVQPADRYNWPVVIVSESDRVYAATTNRAQSDAVSSVDVWFSAAAGDVLALDYKISTEAGYDFMTIAVNGETVKRFSGERDWSAYAYAFAEEGNYTVTLAYVKDGTGDRGDDVVCFDNLRLLSGDEAAAALAAMPVYPFAEATALTIANEDAREITIDDPSGILARGFAPDARYYIVPGDTANFVATLAEGSDPDSAIAYSIYDYAFHVLSDCVVGDAYAFSSGVNSIETNGVPYCGAMLISGDEVTLVVYFNSEENLNAFFLANLYDEATGYLATWAYADDERAVAPIGMSNYTLVYVDQKGDPVEGVIANICDDSACTPMFSDADGAIFFQYPSFAYHIQVLRVPEGYVYDLTEESYLAEEGGTYTFVITKQ